MHLTTMQNKPVHSFFSRCSTFKHLSAAVFECCWTSFSLLLPVRATSRVNTCVERSLETFLRISQVPLFFMASTIMAIILLKCGYWLISI